jgi:hypothetical protein
MHEKAILQLDQAALALVQALDTYGAELKSYLEPEHLESLRAEVVNLRRVLLGLEMGLLYQGWEVPDEVLAQVAGQEMVPVEEAANHVVDMLNGGQWKDDQ